MEQPTNPFNEIVLFILLLFSKNYMFNLKIIQIHSDIIFEKI
jgi:hypothetical protein